MGLVAIGIGAARGPTALAQPASDGEIRFGVASAPTKTTGAVRLATYNTQGLFDNDDDPALSDANDDMKSVKPEAQLRGVAAAIHALDADVLALQEVESEKVLLWFRDTYLKDMGYTYAASPDAGDPRGIEQSVLSRYPITAVKNWVRAPLKGVHPENADAPEGSPVLFHRSPLMVDVRAPGLGAGATPYEFTLLVVHMKSGRGSWYWREAEAARTVELVGELEKEKPGRNVMVVGDFNSVPLDRSLRTFVSAALGGGLIDLFADRVPVGAAGAEGAATFVTHESGRTIDYILYNTAMAPEVVATGSGAGRFILGTPARPAGVDWRTYPAPEGYGSDHYPVVVEIVPCEGGGGGGGGSTGHGEREGSGIGPAQPPKR